VKKSQKPQYVMMDGNGAAVHVAYRLSEVIAIYPITPSSPMGEEADEMAARREPNLWGTVPSIQEMQSEGGAAGAVHGALQTGALTTTFTASQGLLLMIPNMYKIAGELTPCVFHVAARSLAAQALSIFGDQSDVMAARQTGFAMLCSSSVQEVMDLALVAHAATLGSRVPFMHFFDGFRTSHEIAKIRALSGDDIRALIDDDAVLAHRRRALTPDAPFIRGTAQNPDVYFQARESVNAFYNACPGLVQDAMDRVAAVTGRQYRLFDYYGPADAERVIVIMGSGAEACQDTADRLAASGEKVGLVKVRLYRPFDVGAFIRALPATVKSVAALDRTKEPGSSGEPLYLDVVNALHESAAGRGGAGMPRVIGGRYGLSSKEFTPAMIKAVYDELGKPDPKNHFTVGINDDVTRLSLDYDPGFTIEDERGVRAVFYGLGSDGTVGANKNSIKIIGENTGLHAQGYFVYDSKKAGSVTISHLRFGPRPIHSTYLVTRANFIGCHQFNLLNKYDVLETLDREGVFLLNSPYPPGEIWDRLPARVQEKIINARARFYVIDAYRVARETGMGARINTVMQTCFFAISGVLPRAEAVAAIKNSIRKGYGKKGTDIIEMNYRAVDRALAELHAVAPGDKVTAAPEEFARPPGQAPDFVKNVIAEMISGRGDRLPVSRLPADGTYPSGTAKWEKRAIAPEIPVWDQSICIQCGKCVLVCPHAAIRAGVYAPGELDRAPASFKSVPAKDREFKGMNYTIQVSPLDCTGCALCVDACPVKNRSDDRLRALNLSDPAPLQEAETANWEFFGSLPPVDRALVRRNTVRGVQALEPLFEFSGACAGCGETPYIKLMTQLFGDRAVVANATGCSSIYGGNLPTTPWTANAAGRGPAWSNSLFEDNAEFGLGFRLTIDKHREYAAELLRKLEAKIGPGLVRGILEADQSGEPGIFEQRLRVAELKEKLKGDGAADVKHLLSVAGNLVKKSVWIVGGDGWAYDIGFGGLDHVMASGRDVNILVLDTEVYSNTGGQMSKATPRAAVAKFASGGKSAPKKDLALAAINYGTVYVANVAMGAKDEHTVRAFLEAERYNGPSLIIAYSHCIAHGITMSAGLQEQKAAVDCGYWPLFRFNPALALEGKNPLVLDQASAKTSFKEYADRQDRFRILAVSRPEAARELIRQAQNDVLARLEIYKMMAAAPREKPPAGNGL
jgi:pyruvate-ferredoxin/flavodoxin oxidoreductase